MSHTQYVKTTTSTRRAGRGGPHFNIQQPARNYGQRTPTRDEALQRFEADYSVKLVEFESKRKEKEAKKREQYLARYQHVDQGHRLTEPYLDEAVGYAPEVAAFVNSEEEIRLRQQEQLRRDALIFQERQREENERRKKREEEKRMELLKKKSKHLDAGYRLGSGSNNNRAPTTFAQSTTSVVSAVPASSLQSVSSVAAASSVKTISPVPSTSLAEPASSVASISSKVADPSHENKEVMKGRLLAQLETLMSNSTSPSAIQECAPTPAAVVNEKPAKPVSCVLRNPDQGAVLVVRPTEEALSRALARRLEVQDEMDKLGHSAVYQPEVEPVPIYSNNRYDRNLTDLAKTTGAIPKQKSSASSFVPLEAVRKTASPSSSSQQASVPSSSLGAIPKQQPQVPLTSPAAAEPPKPIEEPAIDYQAEMRAARLRMQRQYEETLKKQQENS